MLLNCGVVVPAIASPILDRESRNTHNISNKMAIVEVTTMPIAFAFPALRLNACVVFIDRLIELDMGPSGTRLDS